MSTTYSTQTYTIPQNTQMPVYSNAQQISPPSSTSPTSPRLTEYVSGYNPVPAKQLRPLKSPLYVPAVLRPTEHFPITTPMTPPKSGRNSLEDVEEEHGAAPAQTDFDFYLGQEHGTDERLGEVTGPPTRDHWKPDEASPSCDSPQCRSNFNLFIRKHHCRHCGHIFCASHVSQQIPLDQSAKFHPDGYQSRACETCHRQYQRWDTSRSVRRKNSNNSDESTEQLSNSSLSAPPGHRRMISATSRSGHVPQQPAIPSSVPKDWSWSTF